MKHTAWWYSHPLLFAVVLFAVYGGLATMTSRTMIPTGDEPHHMIVCHSLVVDHDISMINNYRHLDYRLFYPTTLLKRTTLSPDRKVELPAYGIGISFFLAPFYWFALTFFPGTLVYFLRLVMCLATALGIYNLVRLAASLYPERKSGRMLVVLGIALASPIVTYSSQMYPEIIAFLLVVLALRQFHRLASADPSSSRPLFWLALIAPTLLWLHPKYVALCFVMFALSLYYSWRSPRPAAARVAHAVVTAAGIAAFFLFLHSVYGSWSPNRIYGGAQVKTSLIDLINREGAERLWVMVRMFFAYWLDQRFGIFIYAPLYAFFFAAVVWSFRRHLKVVFAPMLLFAAHFLVISYGAQMGGYAPPSRHFVVLVPLLSVPMLLAFGELESRWRRATFVFLEAVGWTIAVLMFSHYPLIFTNATWRNPDGYSEFWTWLHLDSLIPQLTGSYTNYPLTIVWVLLVVLFALLLCPKATSHEPRATSFTASKSLQ